MKNLYLTISILLSILTSFSVSAGELSNKVNLVFIGNSITHAYYLNEEARPPSVTAFILGDTGLNIKYSNCGVSGSTTVDFLPTSNNLFKNVTAAANSLNESDAQLVFSIMLGTNDSAIKGPTGSPVSPDQYKKNLQCIIDSLKLRYPDCKVILNRPLWYSPNTHNSSQYLQEGLDRLQTYFPQIEDIVKENDFVYEGDTEAFDFFKANYLQYLNPESGNSGTFYLHPNQAGAEKLARFWAKAIKTNLTNWGYKLDTNKKKVACIGNSITENTALAEKDKYPSILQRNIGNDYTVRNFGASGHTLLEFV